MKTTSLAATLAAALLAGHALAADAPKADGFRIESEDQFARDYGDIAERAGPGVYQIVQGPLAGKTVAMGEAGLAYDLATLRAQTPKSLRERAQIKARIKQLEAVRARYAQLRVLEARSAVRKSANSLLPCFYRNPKTNATTWYNAFASVNATAGFYMDNGGGGPNYYYARASAFADGTVIRPYGVPVGTGTVTVYATASNVNTGQTVQRASGGISAGVSTGYVYSGPDFSHNLTASASVYGNGDCFGYLSISDALQ